MTGRCADQITMLCKGINTVTNPYSRPGNPFAEATLKWTFLISSSRCRLPVRLGVMALGHGTTSTK
jgi:hypothetical protein